MAYFKMVVNNYGTIHVAHLVCYGVTSIYTHGLKMMALTDENVQVCEKNWIRRFVGVKRADTRRVDKLRVEMGVKKNVNRNW